jgi:signal transduction histidine kinase
MLSDKKEQQLILYVDDEEKNLDSFRVIFRREYNIKVANSADEGLQFMESNDVSLVITDQRMPNMTGVEFLERISGMYPDVVRVILTGYSDEEAIISAINKGKVFRYITKPWKKEELQQTIDYALDAYRLRIENKELLHKLSKANGELDEFVYRASHDLRAPVASVLGLINLSKEESDILKLKEYINLKEVSVLKLDSLIKDIIQFSRNSHLRINTDEINFEQLVKLSLEKHKHFQAAAEINMTFEVKEESPFSSDRFRLEIIMDNLVSNAIRYAKMDQDQPMLNILIESDAKQAKLCVSDNGVGIADDQQEKIFEMFYRGTDDNTGSGLGLYILKETVDKLEGEITVNSATNRGCSFTIIIPNRLLEA